MLPDANPRGSLSATTCARRGSLLITATRTARFASLVAHTFTSSERRCSTRKSRAPFGTARAKKSIPYSSGRTFGTPPPNETGAYQAPVQVWKFTPTTPASAMPNSTSAPQSAEANESDTPWAPPQVAELISDTRTEAPNRRTVRTSRAALATGSVPVGSRSALRQRAPGARGVRQRFSG